MVSKRIPSMSDPLKCDSCGVVFSLDKPTDVDGSFRTLESAGWMHFARRGVGRERWMWKCSTCKPQWMPRTSGLTTPGPDLSRRDGQTMDPNNVARVLGKIGNERGRANEHHVLEACLLPSRPAWMTGARAGTRVEDHAGIDVVVESDVGKPYVQVKSSRTGKAALFRRGSRTPRGKTKRTLSKQSPIRCLQHRPRPIAHPHLCEDAGYVIFHRALDDDERARDLAVRVSACQETEDLELALGQ